MALTVSFLRDSCMLTGLSTVGRKAELLQKLISTPVHTTKNVLAVDLGIHNLAVCSLSASKQGESPVIHHWLMDDLCRPDNVFGVKWSGKFELPEIADLAYQLLARLHVLFQPQYILLEKQRFRTGRATIPEWTLRVNSLECMLHGIHYAQRQIDSAKPQSRLLAINPKQAYTYWSRTTDCHVTGQTYANNKSCRVDLVRELLATNQLVLKLPNGESQFQQFQKEKDNITKHTPKKRQFDLADSALLGLAWIRWQYQLQTFQSMYTDAIMTAKSDPNSRKKLEPLVTQVN
ncbi:cruciform cutting endonuclease Cce1 [Schizosaccharomyces japonicus yFS275]|uniref:Cruciform cutting endonuclease Cce1 n=1 Tax=Schizosaccharomyces japonicus (strain yFS275 / FY16936) TaxID=402676 RepID=B6K7N5_SCHJY|nr:cruciform cutting endonuclease Cce1 [Schizosaccharomyces japonicus yFS275]EEB09539.1 cruciform cutting endonuclease Cce1 [Schizosaccharomyces japonicus yFS275]